MKGKNILLSVAKIGALAGAIGGIGYFSKKALDEMREKYNKQSAYYALAQQWLMNKSQNKDLKRYFEEHGFQKIAVYGMGTLGELFYDEIKDKGIKVQYFIDKNAEEIYFGLDDISVVGLDGIDGQEEVDAIIVTPVFNFDEIEKELEKAGAAAEIVSLEDVVYEV